jgi:hypothetical protein
MSVLERIIARIDEAYRAPQPESQPPKDDLTIALVAWTLFLLTLAVGIGHACSKI